MHNPQLFQASVAELKNVEENNEVNRFVGWAISSLMRRFKKHSCNIDGTYLSVLASMMMWEREMDDEYLEKYYDSNLALMNRGGLTLVHKHFFGWGRKLMAKIRSVYSLETIGRDPNNSFETAKMAVMEDRTILSYFLALCRKYRVGNDTVCKEVFHMVVSKTVHSRFAVVFRRWKECNVKKNGQVAFRIKLKATSGQSTKGKKRPVTPDTHLKEMESSIGHAAANGEDGVSDNVEKRLKVG